MMGLDHLFALVLLVVSAALCVHSAPFGGEKRDPEFSREFMHFGKRVPAAELYDFNGDFNRAFMPFGKRDIPLEEIIADKKNFNREFMHFGKRSSSDQFGREFMHFGKR
ncbi:hypothetical protein M3Y99_00113600 [Aphelenchoides fujianensis]|nr:hypothetical protein M3Y99_00113600 [Aphelenchoides fujianensis]